MLVVVCKEIQLICEHMWNPNTTVRVIDVADVTLSSKSEILGEFMSKNKNVSNNFDSVLSKQYSETQIYALMPSLLVPLFWQLVLNKL